MTRPALLLAVLAAVATRAAATFNPASLTQLSQLRDLNDDQLSAIFATGTAVVPSQEPPYNSNGQAIYDFCVGRTYFNAFTPNSSVARGPWPIGTNNFIVNLSERIWWGKVFYNPGDNPKYTQLWNLLWSNKTVGLAAVAYENATTPFGDGKPSVLIDYSQMEDPFVRPFLDEVRYINDNIWLGRVYLHGDILGYEKKVGKGKRDALYEAIRAGISTAQLDFFNWAGLVGPASLSGVPTDGWYPVGYFGMQCIGPKTPKLRYTSITYLDAALGILRSFLAPDFRLAKLKDKSDPGAVAGPGFPASSESAAGFFPKLTLWPWRWSDIRLASNVTQMKPYKNEPIFGAKELYPLEAQGVAAWRAAGRNYTGWPVTDADQAAIKDIESNKALALAEAAAARSVVAGEQWPIFPGWPLDDQPPTISPPVAEWAADAITAANSAYAAAKADNSTGNPVAQALGFARYHGMLMATFWVDAASLAASTVLQPLNVPGWNATTKAEGWKTAIAALFQNKTALPLKPQTAFTPDWATNKTIAKNISAPLFKPLPDWKGVNMTVKKEEIIKALMPTKMTNISLAAQNPPDKNVGKVG